ncbi:NAD(P)-dependent oxidoreductase [Paenarthrobacter sp. Z7-10]|uniref:SDR family oxidoreductase n=1 Tax=Paenarthrobacter sp. Z7-10 TaxID=2787635 RepID=UPI0022A90A76|nr:NAD(P)-dependent oxidoreductase [Paenarthrobacter sp. Z7-10]MCZ2402905.1 NAD(P)-dependent oxidoreductase [Paenarthrobacter sp. Z7-10]
MTSSTAPASADGANVGPGSSPSAQPSGRSLSGRTMLVSGGSRGIGLAIALRAARDGANIVLLAKTGEPHPSLQGTVFTAAEQLRAAGGQALPLVGDVRKDDDVAAAVEAAVRTFGGIDVVLNNASAIDLSTTDALSMKRYDLMADINVRGSFMLSKFSLPALRRSANPHILTLSPPLNMTPHWAGLHLGYTMAKYGMSMTTLGLAEELKDDGIAVNSLWPCTIIDTAAIRNLPGGERIAKAARRPDIMADAAHAILTRPSRGCTGNFFTDEEVLGHEGITDFSGYSLGAPEDRLVPDIFL